MNKIEIHKGEKKYRCDFRKVSATISGLRNLPQIVESGGNIQSMLPALHSALKSYRVIHKQLCFKVVGRGAGGGTNYFVQKPHLNKIQGNMNPILQQLWKQINRQIVKKILKKVYW